MIKRAGDSDLLSNSDFVDRLIKDQHLILLGELDYGDGFPFGLKTKLIKNRI